MSWKLNKWVKLFPEHEEFLTELRSRKLDRSSVSELAEEVCSEDRAIRLFMASMIWGFGEAGYGPFRTRRILDSPEASANLRELATIASENGGQAAFDHFADMRNKDRNYLKFLGPAFGTKYIYFAQSAKNPQTTTPVMDAVVRRWFVSNTPDTRLVLHYWDPASYATYVQLLTLWAKELSPEDPLRLDQVEYLIFAGPQSNWPLPDEQESDLSVPELIDRIKAHAEADSSLSAEVAELLDRLETLLDPLVERDNSLGELK